MITHGARERTKKSRRHEERRRWRDTAGTLYKEGMDSQPGYLPASVCHESQADCTWKSVRRVRLEETKPSAQELPGFGFAVCRSNGMRKSRDGK